jgi:hypothetical protein
MARGRSAVGRTTRAAREGMVPATTDLPMKKWPPDIMGHIVYGAVTAVGYEAQEDGLD